MLGPKTLLGGFYDKWCSPTTPTPDFVVDDVWCGMVASLGFGAAAAPSLVQFWIDTCKSTYRGDEGRKKLKMALGCLLDRDGLLRRIRDVTCPVYWLQGTEDAPFGVTVPKEQIEMFTSSKEATLEFIEGGNHYLNATNPKEVGSAILKMASKYQ